MNSGPGISGTYRGETGFGRCELRIDVDGDRPLFLVSGSVSVTPWGRRPVSYWFGPHPARTGGPRGA